MRHQVDPNRRGLAVLIVALAAAPAFVQAQQADLGAQLEKLNVRLRTEHYALAGTVSEVRLRHYANALEYIHHEYEVGFRKLFAKREEQQPAARTTQPSDARRGNQKTSSRSRRGKDGASSGATKDGAAQDLSLAEVDPRQRFPVIILARRAEYAEFSQVFFGGPAEHTSGRFIPRHNLLVVLDRGNYDDTYEVLFHEAFHQFMHRYIPDPPVWLNEGLAVHFSYARPTSRGLSFSHPPAEKWKFVRRLISKDQALPLWQVVSAGPAEFYSARPVKVRRYEDVVEGHIYYAQAYTLVHLLLSDRSGVERLQSYIRDLALADGRSSREITEEYFGPDTCRYLTPHWVRYVKSRPEQR